MIMSIVNVAHVIILLYEYQKYCICPDELIDF